MDFWIQRGKVFYERSRAWRQAERAYGARRLAVRGAERVSRHPVPRDRQRTPHIASV